jgi:hypothetical protein
VERARRHQRLLAALAFGILALAAEIVGAGLVHRIDLGRHLRSPSYSHAAYYPAVVAAVKVGIALLLAHLAWRLARAWLSARTAHRTLGVGPGEMPRVRPTLSPRLWLAFFAVTATTYLVHADAARIASGRWALFFPWVHSSALPVFAVLSVLFAVLWSAVQRWLADYEQYAEDAVRRARSVASAPTPIQVFPHVALAVPPRRLFGRVLDGRPPPAAA